jgi:hypothetical protein
VSAYFAFKPATAKDFANLTQGDTVKKQELVRLVTQYGDAIITYRSEQSRKLKYNVCTLDFSTPYIKDKKNRARVSNGTVLFFCWDTDSYRLLNYASVTSVVPLGSVLKNREL